MILCCCVIVSTSLLSIKHCSREIVRRCKEPEQFKYVGLRDRDADYSNEFRDFGGDDQMDIRQSGDGVKLSDK